jgi:RimJ/RimL family protein N-acetyltransferase
MLRGDLVALRARRQSDVAILHEQLHDDVATQSRSEARPWRPISPDSADQPYGVEPRGENAAAFTVVTLADDQVAGDAVLWHIDNHNRSAHIGLSLVPACRGRGFGSDVVAVLCHYGFVVRGMHRLQIETLSDNAAMIAAARKSGFTHEGTLRESGWVSGEFLDEVIYGLLADDWTLPVRRA